MWLSQVPPIKVLGKSVQEVLSHDRTNKQRLQLYTKDLPLLLIQLYLLRPRSSMKLLFTNLCQLSIMRYPQKIEIVNLIFWKLLLDFLYISNSKVSNIKDKEGVDHF